MANEEHVVILRQGVNVWNMWRKEHPDIQPNLRQADLKGFILSRVNLGWADLCEADLCRVDLTGADLGWASLRGANLHGANLRGADLDGVDLRGATLRETDLGRVDLAGADLQGASLDQARVGETQFVNLDLRTVKGLDTLNHRGPSTVGIDTIYKSGGHIPDVFLRGCGVPESLIDYQRSLVGAEEVIQYYSCFISYSTANEDIAQRLYKRLQDAGLRVWYAPQNLRGGKRLYDQVEDAIRIYDRLILILSEESITSDWVETEIRLARRKEYVQKRRMLFPISIVDFTRLRSWQCVDADTERDLAADVRAMLIHDFTRWKDPDAFEAAFAKLLHDLRDDTLSE